MQVNRRTQAERSANTRAALIEAARRLFAVHGFGGVGTEAIGKAAGVTRGALYHQFPDKAELFAAVYEAMELEVTERIGRRVSEARPSDANAALRIGVEAWLQTCADPEIQRIALIEAPAVLGWPRWREISLRHGLGLVEGILQHAVTTGQIAPLPVTALAHVLIGAIDEGALYIAQAADADAARGEVQTVLERLIDSLAAA